VGVFFRFFQVTFADTTLHNLRTQPKNTRPGLAISDLNHCG
jgi:hypothetical protein